MKAFLLAFVSYFLRNNFKKLLLCILIFFSVNFALTQHEAKSASLLETIKEIASWGLGDGTSKWCAKKIGCDDYEDVSIVDSVTGVFSNNKKSRICAASSLVKNIARAYGYIKGGPIGYVLGNLGGNAIECLMMYLRSDGAKKKRDKYEVCLNTIDAGHPLPYTDAQIASMLRKIGIYPDIEIIQQYYNKICIRNKETDEYSFYGDGDYKNDVYVSHMDGYTYVLCASIIDACPCVFNLSEGITTEPEYKKDENGVAIIEDGKLVYEGDDQKDFQERYAKHCRILRYKDLYEQTNDLPPVFDDSCFDLHGYSKRGGASITGAIVQCIEGTARNIFEKPLVNRITTGDNNIDNIAYGYQKDKAYLSSKITAIKNILNSRDIDKIAQGLDLPLTLEEKTQILTLFQEAWYNVMSTDLQYACTVGDKYNVRTRDVNLFTKYLDNPVENPTRLCCPKGGANYSHCYSNKVDFDDLDLFNGDADNYDIITQDKDVKKLTLYEISKQLKILESLQDKIQEKADTFTTGINSLMPDPDENANLSTYLMTLFDLFRNKIKVLALIAITFWFFMIGWKMINGDFAELKMDEFGMMVIKLSMSFFLIFSDVAKNYIFYFAINTADGIGMAIQGIFLGLRDGSDNYFNKVCDYRNTSPFTANSITETNIAERTEKGTKKIKVGDKEYTITLYNFQCPYAIDSKSCSQYDSRDDSVCIEMKCTHTKKVCDQGNGNNEDSSYSLHCNLYYPNVLTGKESDKICVRGTCKYDLNTFIAMPSFERPYKITKYFDRKTSSWEEFRPYCHAKGDESSNITKSKKMFSATLGAYVYVCPSGNLEMDDGYRIKDLYQKGIIDDDTIIYMKSLLSDDDRRGLTNDAEVKATLLDKNIVVRTAAATISSAGNVYDYNFVDEGKTTEGQMRYSYRKFLQSKIDAMNKNSDYPILSVYGLTRDYTSLAFWDSMDCKVIQYLTFAIGNNNSLMDDTDNLVESIKNGDGEGIVDAVGNGLWQAIKLCFMGFPAGFIACFLCLFVGLTLFSMVARACQHYCVCIFNLIVIMYISPFVFTLYLFDQTKGVFKTWKEHLIQNVCGACVPFITVSLFLLVIDYFFFGDEAKYVSEQMFLSDGNIDTSCYEGNLSDAPIACLFVRLTKDFSLLGNIIDLFTGGSASMFEAKTFKMAWYLVLKLLVAVIVIFILDKTYDTIEEKIYSLFGGRPDTDIGVGWSGSVAENAGMAQMAKQAWSGAVTYLKAPNKIIRTTINTSKKIITNITNRVSRMFN